MGIKDDTPPAVSKTKIEPLESSVDKAESVSS